MGLLHFHSEIPRIQASVKAEADESVEAAAAQHVEFKFRWWICIVCIHTNPLRRPKLAI